MPSFHLEAGRCFLPGGSGSLCSLGIMTRILPTLVVIICISALQGCLTLPEHRTLAAGSVAKTGTADDQHPRFTKQEFRELLIQLKPLFDECGFRCYDDGTSGGFSIIEGPIHYASYGIPGSDGTWLSCSIKATRKRLRITINEYEDRRRSGSFTTTKTETDAIAAVIQRIRDKLSSSYPNLTFKVKEHETKPFTYPPIVSSSPVPSTIPPSTEI